MVDWKEFLGWALDSIEKGRLILRIGYESYPGGALHLSDRTGLSPENLLRTANDLGFRENAREDDDFFVFEKD